MHGRRDRWHTCGSFRPARPTRFITGSTSPRIRETRSRSPHGSSTANSRGGTRNGRTRERGIRHSTRSNSGRGTMMARWLFTGDTSRVSGQLKAIPDLPITEMAVGRATLSVLTANAAPRETPSLAVGNIRERWNDYGIGLLLQGHIRGAEAAFLRVTQIDPGYADGWVNIARARIQEGNLAGAEEILRKALTVDPALAKTHFFLGTTLRALGRYDEALTHLRQAASSVPARPRRAESDRARAVPEARVCGSDRRIPAGARHRPGRSAGPLQPDAVLPGPRRSGGRRAGADALRAVQGRRGVAVDYRRLSAAEPDDNNERQSIHEHRTVSIR